MAGLRYTTLMYIISRNINVWIVVANIATAPTLRHSTSSTPANWISYSYRKIETDLIWTQSNSLHWATLWRGWYTRWLVYGNCICWIIRWWVWIILGWFRSLLSIRSWIWRWIRLLGNIVRRRSLMRSIIYILYYIMYSITFTVMN